MTQKGQTVVLFALILTGLIAVVGLAVDLGMLVHLDLRAQGDVSNACVYAADSLLHGENAQSAFYQSLAANGVPAEGYQPTSGSGTSLIRGITIESKSLRTAIRYEADTYFMQIVGIRTMTVSARAHCSTTGARLTPIAVKYKSWEKSYNTGVGVDVLGKGAEADIDNGKSYRGAVYPFIWCVNSESDMTPNSNCAYKQIFPPLTVTPPSAQSIKAAIGKCWSGYECSRVLAPVSTRVPSVSGTSDSQLVKSAKDSGLIVGERFIAMIYDGSVQKPDPSYGNWENIAITGYALFEVTKTTTNTITARALTPIVLNIDELFYLNNTLFYPEEIPWNASSGW